MNFKRSSNSLCSFQWFLKQWYWRTVILILYKYVKFILVYFSLFMAVIYSFWPWFSANRFSSNFAIYFLFSSRTYTYHWFNRNGKIENFFSNRIPGPKIALLVTATLWWYFNAQKANEKKMVWKKYGKN